MTARQLKSSMSWPQVTAGKTALGRGMWEGWIQITRLQVTFSACAPETVSRGHAHTQLARRCEAAYIKKTLGKVFLLEKNQVKGAGNKSCHVYMKWRSVDVYDLNTGYVLLWHSTITDTRKQSSTRFGFYAVCSGISGVIQCDGVS